MKPGLVHSAIEIVPRSGLELKAGELVSMRVLKNIIGNRWAVSFKGKVFTAVSQVDLKPGMSLTARTERHADGILLRIVDKSVFPDIPESIVTGILNSRLRTSPRIWKALRNLVGGSKDRKRDRLVSLLLEKGVDPTSKGWNRLFKILASAGGDGQGKRDQKDRTDYKKRLKQIVVRKAGGKNEENPLQLFNHLRGAKDNWVMIPFHMDILQGILKLKIPAHSREPKQVVVDVSDGTGKWSFSLSPARKRIHLRISCSDEEHRRQGYQKIPELMSKLQNHGVECDDSIYDEKEFDGFSPIWEGVGGHQIDTYR